MAKIYSSRQMLDPNAISYMNTDMQNRINNERERNRLMHDSVRYGLGALGKAFDSAYDEYKTKRDAKKRYDEVMSLATKVQMTDPLFVAATRDYSRTGSASPLTSYQLQKETAEANRIEREKQKSLEKEHNYPSYIEAVRKMNAELDKPVPDYEVAEQYKAEAEFLNKKYGYTQADLSNIMDARRKTAEAKATQAAEDAAAEAMGQRNLIASEELEASRQLNAQKFLSNIDTKLALAKTPEDRSAIMDEILAATEGDTPILTKAEAVDAITKARSTKTASEEMADAVASAVRSNVTGDIKETHEKKKKQKDELEKILDKQKRGIPLSSRERRILEQSKGGK